MLNLKLNQLTWVPNPTGYIMSLHNKSLSEKRLTNNLILHFFQDGSDSVLTLFTPTKTAV